MKSEKWVLFYVFSIFGFQKFHGAKNTKMGTYRLEKRSSWNTSKLKGIQIQFTIIFLFSRRNTRCIQTIDFSLAWNRFGLFWVALLEPNMHLCMNPVSGLCRFWFHNFLLLFLRQTIEDVRFPICSSRNLVSQCQFVSKFVCLLSEAFNCNGVNNSHNCSKSFPVHYCTWRSQCALQSS